MVPLRYFYLRTHVKYVSLNKWTTNVQLVSFAAICSHGERRNFQSPTRFGFGSSCLRLVTNENGLGHFGTTRETCFTDRKRISALSVGNCPTAYITSAASPLPPPDTHIARTQNETVSGHRLICFTTANAMWLRFTQWLKCLWVTPFPQFQLHSCKR